MANKVPGFNGFTGFNIGVVSSDMILPMKEFMQLYKNMVQGYFGAYEEPKEFENFTHGIPKTRLFVSFQDGVTAQERQVVKNAISSLVDNESSNDL